MTKWLTIIGMGEDGYEGLSARAKLALQNTRCDRRLRTSPRFSPRIESRAPGMAAALLRRRRANETPARPQHGDPRHRRSHELRRGAQAARVHSLRGNDHHPPSLGLLPCRRTPRLVPARLRYAHPAWPRRRKYRSLHPARRKTDCAHRRRQHHSRSGAAAGGARL